MFWQLHSVCAPSIITSYSIYHGSSHYVQWPSSHIKILKIPSRSCVTFKFISHLSDPPCLQEVPCTTYNAFLGYPWGLFTSIALLPRLFDLYFALIHFRDKWINITRLARLFDFLCTKLSWDKWN